MVYLASSKAQELLRWCVIPEGEDLASSAADVKLKSCCPHEMFVNQSFQASLEGGSATKDGISGKQ